MRIERIQESLMERQSQLVKEIDLAKADLMSREIELKVTLKQKEEKITELQRKLDVKNRYIILSPSLKISFIFYNM